MHALFDGVGPMLHAHESTRAAIAPTRNVTGRDDVRSTRRAKLVALLAQFFRALFVAFARS